MYSGSEQFPWPPREMMQGGTRLPLSPREQAETSIKMEGLRSNTTIAKFS
jgi:hypothetical protein